jgi:NADH:ubiquinone oxidoreductase subunit E
MTEASTGTAQGSRKRDVSLPKGRQVEDQALAEVTMCLGALPRRRDLLIEALHLIQDAHRCLQSRHLAALADLFRGLRQEISGIPLRVDYAFEPFGVLGNRHFISVGFSY